MRAERRQRPHRQSRQVKSAAAVVVVAPHVAQGEKAGSESRRKLFLRRRPVNGGRFEGPSRRAARLGSRARSPKLRRRPAARGVSDGGIALPWTNKISSCRRRRLTAAARDNNGLAAAASAGVASNWRRRRPRMDQLSARNTHTDRVWRRRRREFLLSGAHAAEAAEVCLRKEERP